MDPATLYMIVTLSNGHQRPYQKDFDSPAACEEFIARKPANVVISRYACATKQPAWFPEDVIRGVPVDPAYMR